MMGEISKINKLADEIRKIVGEKHVKVNSILDDIIEVAEEIQDEADAFSNQVDGLQCQLDDIDDNEDELFELAELKEMFEDITPSTVEEELKLKELKRLFKYPLEKIESL